MWAGLFAVAGIFHGYAFGESIFGAETSPLHAYLLGLILIQGALTVAAALFARRSGGVSQLAPRLAGGVIIGVGVTVLIGALLPRPLKHLRRPLRPASPCLLSSLVV